jgi:hypothetical protein
MVLAERRVCSTGGGFSGSSTRPCGSVTSSLHGAQRCFSNLSLFLLWLSIGHRSQACRTHPSTIREFLMKCFVGTRHSGQLILQHPAQGQAGDCLSYESGSSNLRSVPDNGREGSQEDSIGKDCHQEERKMRRHSGLQTPTIAHFGVNKYAEAAGMLDIQRRRYLCS